MSRALDHQMGFARWGFCSKRCTGQLALTQSQPQLRSGYQKPTPVLVIGNG